MLTFRISNRDLYMYRFLRDMKLASIHRRSDIRHFYNTFVDYSMVKKIVAV